VGTSILFEVTGSDRGVVWGTDTYTDDSSVATAAVHAGALAVGERGVIRVTLLPGQRAYQGSTRRGVATMAYGPWARSFRIESVHSFGTEPAALGALAAYRGEVGKTLLFQVTGGAGGSGALWGTDIYTDDSSLAAAAVHAGVLTVGQKGVVRVTILPGQAAYAGSVRHGVTSGSWASWPGSFRVEALRD
jgi:hypothetical protein